jgi:hypothetical protein
MPNTNPLEQILYVRMTFGPGPFNVTLESGYLPGVAGGPSTSFCFLAGCFRFTPDSKPSGCAT